MRKSLKNKKPLATFKRRHFFPIENRGLVWGTSGALLLTRGCFVVSSIFWLKVRMKWHYKTRLVGYRKNDTKGKRTYWHRVRSFLPCTRKAEKSRMGKGKGKLAGLFANLNAGFFLIEMKITKTKIVSNLVKYLNSKLGARLQLVIAKTSRPFQSFGSKDVNYSVFKHRNQIVRRLRRRNRNYLRTRTDLQHY